MMIDVTNGNLIEVNRAIYNIASSITTQFSNYELNEIGYFQILYREVTGERYIIASLKMAAL